VGVFEWGPLETATPVADYDHFREIFGPGRCLLANYESPAQLQQWFLGNKGQRAIIVRVTHKVSGVTQATKATHTAQTDTVAPTKGQLVGDVALPVALADGDQFDFSVNGGGTDSAVFNAAAAAFECTNAETYALSDAQTLIFEIDNSGSQTVTFNTAEFVAIGAATAEEVAAVINGEARGCSATVTSGGTKVTITSDTLGTGSELDVTGGTAAATLGFTITTTNGTGDAVNSASVTGAELKTLVEGDVSGCTVSGSAFFTIETDTPGSGGSIQLEATNEYAKLSSDTATHTGFDGTAVNTLKLDAKYYGAMGNQITYDVADASNGVAADFNLVFYIYGVFKERHLNVTMDTTGDRYVEDVLNTSSEASGLIVGTDQSATGTVLQRRPVNVTGQALTGGDDGLTSLDDADFYGGDTYDDGFYAFNGNPDGDILCVPDRPTTTLQNQALTMCSGTWSGKCVFVPDPPDNSDKDAIVTHMASVSSDEYGAGMPWPRVLVPNPDKVVYGKADTIELGPSVSWAARMARNSQEYDDGEFHQPGNEDHGLLTNVVGLEGETTADIRHEVRQDGVRDYVTDNRVNPVLAGRRLGGGFGVWVNDVQNLKPTSNLWSSVGEVRGVAACRKDIEAYMETRRTQPNSEDNRLIDKDAIEAYMVGRTVKGSFASKKASEAFYVNTDPKGEGINNPLEQKAQKYHILVGMATADPARFIDLGFTKDQRAIQSYVQQQMAGQ
jgi:hypothetical protein